MKTRNGFVSNSSTSSFVVVTTKTSHETALSKMPKCAKKIIKQIMNIHTECFGQKIVAGFEFTDGGGGGTWEEIDTELKQEETKELIKFLKDLDPEMDIEEEKSFGYMIWETYTVLLDKENTFTINAGDGG